VLRFGAGGYGGVQEDLDRGQAQGPARCQHALWPMDEQAWAVFCHECEPGSQGRGRVGRASRRDHLAFTSPTSVEPAGRTSPGRGGPTTRPGDPGDGREDGLALGGLDMPQDGGRLRRGSGWRGLVGQLAVPVVEGGADDRLMHFCRKLSQTRLGT
jgi:hypothetical protein